MSDDLEERKKVTQRQERLAGIIALLLLATAAIGFIFRVGGCSVEPKKETVVQPAPTLPDPGTGSDGSGTGSDPAVVCGASPAGSTQTLPCPGVQIGQHTQVCSAAGTWLDVSNTCTDPPKPTCAKTTFADVQPLLQQYCTSCHAAITTYATAQSWSAEIVRRTQAPTGNNDHMPPTGRDQLCPLPDNAGSPVTCDKVDLLKKWYGDGSPLNCDQAQTPTFIDLNYQDTAALNDAASLSASDRPFIRYIYMGHAIDAGLSKADQTTWVQAGNKAFNSLNGTSQNLFPMQSVEPQGAVWRVDLRNYAMDLVDAKAIEDGDVNINIIDNTSKGQALQALIGSKKPWFHLDNFVDVAFRNSAVYYQVLNVPTKIQDLQKQIGVNFDDDLANLTNVNFLGFNSSPIAEQKNRLIVRFIEQRDSNAAYWQTFDVNGVPHFIDVVVNGAVVQQDTKNLYQFPLLAGTGAKAAPPGATLIFTQDASEAIWTLPNGLHGYVLVDAAGNRLNFADPNVVIDTQTPLGNRVINNANSCLRCHNGGFIPNSDEVLAAVTRTGLPNANDLQIVKAVYKAAGAGAAFFKKDNVFYTAALAKIGVDTNRPDPMNVVTDRFLQNWDAQMVASLLFLTKDQLTVAINGSPTALAEIGGLVNGQTVTFTQLTGALQQLIADAGLFKDTLGN